eukprot:TRINITY_DN28533_c0_g1_i1.p1 TRINITY_DN28533_c0_g1~~TRINITY_DN28533_c0_g1_i1.p1  ORF type:complete len:877 (+),score=349.17 TRINITY_DN28533_c0_g1_i1:239-2632(+)
MLQAKMVLAYRRQVSKSFLEFFFTGQGGADPVVASMLQGHEALAPQALLRIFFALPAEGQRTLLDAYPLLTDAARIMCSLTDELGPFVFHFGTAVVKHYSKQCADGAFDGCFYTYDDPAVRGSVQEIDAYFGYYSKVTALQSTLEAVNQFLPSLPTAHFPGVSDEEARDPKPSTHPALFLVDGFFRACIADLLRLLCICDCDEVEVEELECRMAVDMPSSLHCSLLWFTSNFFKDSDDGGPSPEYPAAKHVAAEAINACLLSSENAKDIASALLMLQKLSEVELLPMSMAPVEVMLSLINQDPAVPGNPYLLRAPNDARIAVKARACVALSAIAGKTLEPDKHAHLIHLQCAQVADASNPLHVKVKASMGLGYAVARAEMNGTVPYIQREAIQRTFPSFLATVPESPVLLIESLNNILQILPSVVVTAQFIKPTLETFMRVLKENESNTRLLCNVLRVFSQGVVEEHSGKERDVCLSILEFATSIMRLVLSDSATLSLQGLAKQALEIAGAVSACECECSSVAPQLALSVSSYKAEGKETIRAACRALALSVSAAARRHGDLGEQLSGRVAQFCQYYTTQSLDMPTMRFVGSACLVAAGHLPLDTLARVVAHCNTRVAAFYPTSDFMWPVNLTLMWPALLARCVVAGGECELPRVLEVLGDAPAQHVQFFTAWLTVDAVLEPRVRHISTAAAEILLGSLPREYFMQHVSLEPVRTLSRRREAPISVPLGDALYLAVLRSVEKPLTKFSSTFLAKDSKVLLPLSEGAPVQQRAMGLIQALAPEKRQELEAVLRQLSCQ